MTFIMGRGSTRAVVPPTYRQSGRPTAAAPALAQARLTPRKALAPRRLLLSVAVKFAQCSVDSDLVECVTAAKGVGNFPIDRGYCLPDAPSAEAGLVAIPQLDYLAIPTDNFIEMGRLVEI